MVFLYPRLMAGKRKETTISWHRALAEAIKSRGSNKNLSRSLTSRHPGRGDSFLHRSVKAVGFRLEKIGTRRQSVAGH